MISFTIVHYNLNSRIFRNIKKKIYYSIEQIFNYEHVFNFMCLINDYIIN